MVDNKFFRRNRCSPFCQVCIIKLNRIESAHIIRGFESVRISIMLPLFGLMQFSIQIIGRYLVSVYILTCYRRSNISRVKIVFRDCNCRFLLCLVIRKTNYRINRINYQHIRLILCHLIIGSVFVFSRHHIVAIAAEHIRSNISIFFLSALFPAQGNGCFGFAVFRNKRLEIFFVEVRFCDSKVQLNTSVEILLPIMDIQRVIIRHTAIGRNRVNDNHMSIICLCVAGISGLVRHGEGNITAILLHFRSGQYKLRLSIFIKG